MGDTLSSSGVLSGFSGISYQRVQLSPLEGAFDFSICPVGIGLRSHPTDPSVYLYADVSDGKNEKRFERK